MTVVAGFDPTDISLSDSAVGKLQFLIAEEDNPSLRFRVYITGGGCSGFQYGFTFDEKPAEDDWVIEREGVAALIDSMSYQYLMGSEVRTPCRPQLPQEAMMKCSTLVFGLMEHRRFLVT